VPPEKYAAPPPKPWYLHHEPYLIAGGVIALIGGLWYLSRRRR
jgi:LPXTG-motif cell wall-anchored protein